MLPNDSSTLCAAAVDMRTRWKQQSHYGMEISMLDDRAHLLVIINTRWVTVMRGSGDGTQDIRHSRTSLRSNLMIQHGPRSTATAAEARQLFNSLASFTPIVRSWTAPPYQCLTAVGLKALPSAGSGRAHPARVAAEGRTVQRPPPVRAPPPLFTSGSLFAPCLPACYMFDIRYGVQGPPGVPSYAEVRYGCLQRRSPGMA